MKSKRLCYLDLLRIIACFLVIFNHTSGYMDCFNYAEGSSFISVLFRLFVGMVIKLNVPLFFMISGTLMLNRDWKYKDVFKKVVYFSLILLIFSVVANVCYTGKLYLPGFIRNFLSATVDGAGPYWYLYTYIGMLLIIIFMRYISSKMTLKDTWYIIAARFIITGVLPMMCLFLNILLDSTAHIAGDFNPFLIMTDCGFYFLVGYGLDRLFDIRRLGKKGAFLMVLFFVGSNVLECFLTYIAGPQNVYRGYDFVMTLSLFMLIKYLFTVNDIPEKAEKAISAAGKLTFGMYLLDPIIGNVLKPATQNSLEGKIAPLLISCIYCTLSMIAGGIMTAIYYKGKSLILNRSK